LRVHGGLRGSRPGGLGISIHGGGGKAVLGNLVKASGQMSMISRRPIISFDFCNEEANYGIRI
jgi:hypothetical protein